MAANYAVWAADDNEVIFGNDSDFKIKYDSADNRLEILNAANTVLARLSTAGALTLADDLAVLGGDITTTAATATVFNSGPTTLNIGGAATQITLGPSGGTLDIGALLEFNGGGNNTIRAFGGRDLILRLGSTGGANLLDIRDAGFTRRATISDIGDLVCNDIACNGGDLTSTATTFNLLASPTTVNAFAGASAALNIGHASAKAAFLGGLSIADAKDMAFGTTTGGKLGTSALQKIGIWGATPIVQPAAIANAAYGNGSWTDSAAEEDFNDLVDKVNAILARDRTIGLMAA